LFGGRGVLVSVKEYEHKRPASQGPFKLPLEGPFQVPLQVPLEVPKGSPPSTADAPQTGRFSAGLRRRHLYVS
jgi:hypothetical protein